MSIQKWTPDDNPQQARRIGKTGEETNELGAVLFRIQIQGLDAIDPGSGKSNRQRFFEEMADVQAQINCNHRAFEIPDWFEQRVALKESQMRNWEAHFHEI